MLKHSILLILFTFSFVFSSDDIKNDTMYYKNGDIHCIYEFNKNGLLNGYFKEYYPNASAMDKCDKRKKKGNSVAWILFSIQV